MSECSYSDDSCNADCSPQPLTNGAAGTDAGGTDGGKLRHVKSTQKQDKLCVVCGAKALGCNFDAVSCESCKAFFRRNAFKESVRTIVSLLGVFDVLVNYIEAVNYR